jgi:hypothetical protein
MNSFIIEDRLDNNGISYLFATKYINNLIISKIFILDVDERSIIKEMAMAIENIDFIKDEMVNFHNLILSKFFKALRNGDKNPEDSMNDIDDKDFTSDNLLLNYIETLLDTHLIAISVSNNSDIEYIMSSDIDESISSNIKINMDFSYELISRQRDNIYHLIGDIDYTIFSYEECQILYYEIDKLKIVFVVSSNNRLANSIKIANQAKDSILRFIREN